jgi:hypothetical protein
MLPLGFDPRDHLYVNRSPSGSDEPLASSVRTFPTKTSLSGEMTASGERLAVEKATVAEDAGLPGAAVAAMGGRS